MKQINRLYKCLVCGLSFPKEAGVRYHIKSKHNKNWVENVDKSGRRLPLSDLYKVMGGFKDGKNN